MQKESLTVMAVFPTPRVVMANLVQVFQPPNFSRSLYAQLWQVNLVIAECFVYPNCLDTCTCRSVQILLIMG